MKEIAHLQYQEKHIKKNPKNKMICVISSLKLTSSTEGKKNLPDIL